jgi:hypothetical protein
LFGPALKKAGKRRKVGKKAVSLSGETSMSREINALVLAGSIIAALLWLNATYTQAICKHFAIAWTKTPVMPRLIPPPHDPYVHLPYPIGASLIYYPTPPTAFSLEQQQRMRERLRKELSDRTRSRRHRQ